MIAADAQRKNKDETMNLRQKNSIPVLIIVIVMCSIGAVITFHQLNKLKEDMAVRLVENIRHVLLEKIDAAAENALETAAIFSRIPGVVNAFEMAHSGNIDDEHDPKAQQARDILRKDLKPFMQGFSSVKNGEKLKLHFHLPNGRRPCAHVGWTNR